MGAVCMWHMRVVGLVRNSFAFRDQNVVIRSELRLIEKAFSISLTIDHSRTMFTPTMSVETYIMPQYSSSRCYSSCAPDCPRLSDENR